MKYLIPFTLLFFVSCVKEDILLPKQVEVVLTPKQAGVEYQPIQFDEVDKFLSTPASGAELIVKVVIINYIPSKDKGKTLDQTTFPFRNDRGNFDPNLPVSEYKKWLLSGDIRTKAAIEEGSKFRNYNNTTKPYVGIEVVKYINVYEIPKIERKISESRFAIDSTEAYYPDYKKLFKELNMEDLVNNQGVKEIWFNRKSLSVPETNMSSPSSGDISNGYYEQGYQWNSEYENNDLPVYKKTYVVYSHFIHFGYDNNLHVRGHQIERQMSRINNSMWNTFVGPLTSNGRPKGCGNTHFPVNASRAYDYDNSTPFNSEITNWNPSGTANPTTVSSSSWKKGVTINYVMPTSTYKTETSRNVIGNDPQGGWMIYWFQSIPSKDNNIPYGNKKLTDWWDIYYNWDDAIINKKNLFKDGN
jgi:hypothetical protein